MVKLFLLFVFGCCVGSFLNVLIDRLPRRDGDDAAGEGKKPGFKDRSQSLALRNSPAGRKETILLGRSYCESCSTPLLWFDLIPLFSFLWLGGKCRHCGEKIPVRIPIVELLTGIGFAVLFWFISDSRRFMADFRGGYFWSQYFVYCTLFSSFLVLFFTDLEYGVLPDAVVFPSIAVAVLWHLFNALQHFTTLFHTFLLFLTPAVGLALFFLLVILITQGQGMGRGDVKLGFLMGLILGWPSTLVAAYLAFLFGAMVSVILLIGGAKKIGQRIPFGPFLIAGTAVSVLYGEVIWNAYVGLL